MVPHDKEIVKHDYVLATKYHDGNSAEGWCVGFFDRTEKGEVQDRHFIVSITGLQFRAGSGYRRMSKISKARGEFILSNVDNIELSHRSLWWWKRCKIDALDKLFKKCGV